LRDFRFGAGPDNGFWEVPTALGIQNMTESALYDFYETTAIKSQGFIADRVVSIWVDQGKL
jgi:hypothetical protein